MVVSRSKIVRDGVKPLGDLKNYGMKDVVESGVLPNKPPIGLWYQVGNSWEVWCEGNMPEWLNGRKVEFDLDISNIVVLRNNKEVDQFYEEYGIARHDPLPRLDWDKIMSLYDGIEIPNFQYRIMGGFGSIHWTYGWDCSSGCVWNAESCITNLKDSVKNVGLSLAKKRRIIDLYDV